MEAKKKWKNLKDKYRKLIQKPLKSGSAAVSQNNKWRFFDLMKFTKDTMMPGQTFGNLSTSFGRHEAHDIEAHDESFEDTQNMNNEEEDEQTSSNKTTNAAPLTTFSNARPHRSKLAIGSKNVLEKEMVEIEKQKLNAILEIQKSAKTEHEGDDYHFLMSLLPFMKNLDPILKLELRGKIQTEVFNSYKTNQQMTAPQLVVFDRQPTQTSSYISPHQQANNLLSPSIASSSASSHYQGSQFALEDDFATNTFGNAFSTNVNK